jgi:hypothetical protein
MSTRTESYDQRAIEQLRPVLAELQAFTEPCRIDMHEPDEQGLTAHVVGSKLDNAHGTQIQPWMLLNDCHEMIVYLQRDGDAAAFNLADLIALARLAPL